jgi:hypothetical protein
MSVLVNGNALAAPVSSRDWSEARDSALRDAVVAPGDSLRTLETKLCSYEPSKTLSVLSVWLLGSEALVAKEEIE